MSVAPSRAFHVYAQSRERQEASVVVHLFAGRNFTCTSYHSLYSASPIVSAGLLRLQAV